MDFAVGEQQLRWLASEERCAEPDLPALVATYSGLLYRVSYSVLRQAAEAEDVVQETFLRVLQHPAKLAAINDLRPWLVRIAWNLSLDRKRRITPQQIDDASIAALVSPETPADQALDAARHLASVLAIVERLPRRQRAVLLLSALEELTTAEIASVLNHSESTVRSLLFRARTQIRQRLAAADSGQRQQSLFRKGGPSL
jgi:RNA polymerase sigma-70 factor, ECF subfamily